MPFALRQRRAGIGRGEELGSGPGGAIPSIGIIITVIIDIMFFPDVNGLLIIIIIVLDIIVF